MSMFFGLILLFAALGLASQLGWSVDSRDSADWRQSDAGERAASLRPTTPVSHC